MTAEELEEIGIVAIVRAKHEVQLEQIVASLFIGGINAIELTLNTPGALAGITAMRSASDGAVRVGAGTILSPDDAQAAIDAGAEFIVTPTVQPDTIALCRRAGVPIACGAMTPTEALAVYQAGADFVKLFPAESLGVSYIRSLLGPLPFLRIIPTGGVNRENLSSFVQAGCAGVALGSNLVSADVLKRHDWTLLEQTAREYAEIWAQARREFPRS